MGLNAEVAVGSLMHVPLDGWKPLPPSRMSTPCGGKTMGNNGGGEACGEADGGGREGGTGGGGGNGQL